MSDKIKDVIDTLKELKDLGSEPIKVAIIQKTKSPLFGGFIIAWLAYNWDRVFITLSTKLDVLEKISIIHKIPDNSTILGLNISHTHTFFFPLFISIAVAIIAPFIPYLFDKLQNNVINKTYENSTLRKSIQLDLDSTLIESQVKYEAARELARLDVEAKREELKANISETKANVAHLKSEHDVLSIRLDNLKIDHDKLTEEYLSKINESKKLLDTISKHTNEINEIETKFGSLNEIKDMLLDRNLQIVELKRKINELKPSGLGIPQEMLEFQPEKPTISNIKNG